MATPRWFPRAVAVLGLAACLTLAVAAPALATNATNLLGYSAASQSLAGADSVGVLDTSLINSNPASLFLLPDSSDRDPQSLFSGGLTNLSLGVLQSYLHHTDVFGNSREGENNPFLALHGGMAVRLRDLPRLTLGLGLFSQGGIGADFRGLTTAFGTRDDVSSYLRYTKLALAVSYQLTDNLAIGVAPNVGYSDLTLRLLPRTSSATFAGIDIGDRCSRNLGVGEPGSDCPWDVTLGVKAGVTYKITPMVTVGLDYTSPVDFHYRDGRAKLNFSAFGLGQVTYDVDVTGFSWPQQLELGLAVRPTPRLLLAADLAWHQWSAFDHVTLHFRNPRNSAAPANVNIRLTADWRDQYIMALGAAYDLIPEVFTVRGGYNLSTNPIPARTMSPAIQVPFEHHVAAGVGYRPAKHWEMDAAFAYAFEKKVTYTNQELPFGPNATEAPSGFSIDLTVGYRF